MYQNFVSQFGGIVIHCVKDMCHDLNLCLDNIDFDLEGTSQQGSPSSHNNSCYPSLSADNEFTMLFPSVDHVPEGSIEMDILNLLKVHNGVSTILHRNCFLNILRPSLNVCL